jgi:hypothetical protein
MSSPTKEANSKRESNSTMDPADLIQNHQFITFPRTDTTWTILYRLADYQKHDESTTNSFVKPVIFKVVIGGTGRKSMPPGIPRTAIIKVQSLLVYIPAIFSPVDGNVQSLINSIHTITKYNKDKKNFDRKTILNSSTREEVVALNQLTLNKCSSAPTLIDHKVVLHDEMPGKEIYVSFILMTEVPGISLKQANFWMLQQVERDMVRQAFRKALSEIHACWVVLEGYDSGGLVWCLRENKMYILHSLHSSVHILQQLRTD